MTLPKLITKRDVISGVSGRWHEQYSPLGKWDVDKRRIAEKLAAMDLEKATEQDVYDIIGNGSWTRMTCDQCKQEVDTLVRVGEEPDYGSKTAMLCPVCLKAAFDLLKP